MNKKIKLLAILFIAVLSISFLKADASPVQINESESVSVSSFPPDTLSYRCRAFLHRLYRGATDARTNGEVTRLQRLLAEDPTVYPEGLITGYYGSLTEKAVQRWQVKEGIVSSGNSLETGYGMVGPKTRARMISFFCPSEGITVLSPNGGEQWLLGDNQTIRWTSNYFTGESLLLRGSDVDIDLISSTYCNNNREEPCPLSLSYAPSFSIALARDIPNSGSFSWTVGENIYGDSIPPGFYVVRISNSNNPSQYDQSDYAFNILREQSGNRAPTISGVSGPSALKIGETGEWKIKASDPEQGPLTYSVVWGDEAYYGPGAARETDHAPSVITQTSTFTHTYSKRGVYSPTFTVTDNAGLSTKTSISVNVGEDTTRNQSPVINVVPKVLSNVKVGQSVSFSWYATDEDGDNLSWSVSWGDGNASQGACQSSNSQNMQDWAFNASHTWQRAGRYTVETTVNDCRGGSDKYEFNVTVRD